MGSLPVSNGNITNIKTVSLPVNYPNVTVSTVRDKVNLETKIMGTKFGDLGGSISPRVMLLILQDPTIVIYLGENNIIVRDYSLFSMCTRSNYVWLRKHWQPSTTAPALQTPSNRWKSSLITWTKRLSHCARHNLPY